MKLVYLKNVVTLELDESKCSGCRICTKVCPHGVWRVEHKRARIVDRDACMECGACATNCEMEAITVRSGVGCAAAIINAALGRESACCCTPSAEEANRPTCC